MVFVAGKGQAKKSGAVTLVSGLLLGLVVAGMQFTLRSHRLPDSRGMDQTLANVGSQAMAALQVGAFTKYVKIADCVVVVKRVFKTPSRRIDALVVNQLMTELCYYYYFVGSSTYLGRSSRTPQIRKGQVTRGTSFYTHIIQQQNNTMY